MYKMSGKRRNRISQPIYMQPGETQYHLSKGGWGRKGSVDLKGIAEKEARKIFKKQFMRIIYIYLKSLSVNRHRELSGCMVGCTFLIG